MAEKQGNLQAHMVALVVVGGVALFAFVFYLVASIIYWIFTNPEVLAYTFAVVAALQAYWLVFAFLKRRFHTPGPDAAVMVRRPEV